MSPANALTIIETLQGISNIIRVLAKQCNQEQRDARKVGIHMPLSECPSYFALNEAQRKRQSLRVLYDV